MPPPRKESGANVENNGGCKLIFGGFACALPIELRGAIVFFLAGRPLKLGLSSLSIVCCRSLQTVSRRSSNGKLIESGLWLNAVSSVYLARAFEVLSEHIQHRDMT
jgi:hypothetical protein